MDENDEYTFVQLLNADYIARIPRYFLEENRETLYSRLQIPQAPGFDVPVKPGMFMAISAHWSTEQGVLLYRQLVMISYDENKKVVRGLQITVCI